MRFRHLTSAVAQILLNASSGAILQSNNVFFVSSRNEGGTVYAIDNNSEILYELNATDLYSRGGTGFGSFPIQVYNGKLYVGADDFPSGIDSGDLLGTGAIIAYDAETGIEERKIGIGLGLDKNSQFGRTFKVGSDRIVSMKGWHPYNNQSAVILDLEGNLVAEISDTNIVSNVETRSIEISDNYIFFSDHNNTDQGGTRPGAVHVYDLDGNFVQTLYSPTPSFEEFGYSMTVENNRLFVGARYNSDIGQYIGKIYAFDLTDLSFLNYIYPSNPNNNSLGTSLNFGFYLSSSNGYVFAGCEGHDAPGEGNDSGAAFIFPANKTTSDSAEVVMLDWPSALGNRYDSHFGSSGVIVGDKVLVGAENATNNDGAIAIYGLDGTLFDTIVSPVIGGDGYQFGNFSAGLEGPYPEKLIVAEGRKTYATDRKVYVMDMNGENVIELPEPEGLTQASNSQYASNIEIASEGKLVVIHNESKTAYVYDLTTTNEPTSFTLDGSNSTEDYDFVLDGNKLHTLGIVGGYRKKLMRYDITTGNLEAAFTTSGNYTLIPSTIDVGNGKVVVASGLGTTRRIFTYDIDDTTGASETMITPSKAATESLWNPCRLAVGNGKIVFGDSHTDAIFYIYNLDGSNEIAVDCSNVPLSSYWGSNYTNTIPSTQRVGYKSVAIGNDKIVVDGGSVGVAFVCNLDGSGLFAIDMMDSSYGLSSDEVAGAATEVAGSLSIANNKIAISAVQGRVSGNNSDGIVYTFDLDGTNMKQIVSPRGPVSGYQFGKDVAIYDPTGLAKFANLPAVISDIDASYILTEGQDTVITAVGTDPEGDAITWSFEEVASAGSSQIVIGSFLKNNYSGSVFVYENGDLSSSPTEIYPSDVASGDRFGQEISVTPSHMAVSTWNGKVYVYDQSDLSVAPTKLTSPEGSSKFGQEGLAINDTHLFVGQSSGGPDSNGVVYVYSLSDLSASPTELSQTGGEFLGDGGDRFGSVVAADNQSLVVSATHYDNGVGAQNVGRLYVYDVSDLSAAPTVVSNIGYQDNTKTGERELMLTSDKIIVGSSQYKDGNGVRKGVVFVHDRNNLDQAPVIVMGHEENGNFGLDAYADDDILVVGATSENSSTGAAYVYDMSDLSATPTKLTAYDGAVNDSFGWAVHATDSNILIGSYTDDDGGSGSGSVYVYDRSDLSAQPTKLIGQGPNAYFGNTFAGYAPESALNGTTVTQSDNVFTVTPGTTDSNFTLRFKVTDAAGNVTTKTSTFSYDYVNKAPIVSGVVSEYNLTQGQDTVITATGVDPEGDAITWSFEEVASGSSGLLVWDITNPYFYDPAEMNSPSGLNGALGLNGNHMDETYIYTANENHDGVGAVALHPLLDVSASPTILKAPSPTSGETFGATTLSNDDYIFVGARTGAKVYVFNKSDLSHHTTLSATDSSSRFGVSLSVNDTYLFVGADFDDDVYENAGAVYVYDLATFTEQTKLLNPKGSTYFGKILKSTNSKLMVCLRGYDTGRVFVYDTSDFSTAPVELEPVAPYTTRSDFGMDIAVSTKHDKLFVCHRYVIDAVSGHSSGGAVYVYDLNNLSVTPEKILMEDSTQYFGEEMTVVGDTVWVASLFADSDSAIYGYEITDLDATPTIVQKSGSSQYFGITMSSTSPASALNGVTVAQSDNVFTITPGTTDADFQLSITATDSEGNATSVTSTFDYEIPVPVVNDTSVGRIIAAASNNNYSNKLYAFDLDGSNEKELFIPAGMDNNSQFGAHENMAIDGTTLVVGQRTEQRVFVYDLATTNEPIEITPPAPSNLYGTSVAISDGKIIVGTYEGASTVGAFYIYDLDGSNEIKVTEPAAGLPAAGGNQNGWTKFGWKVAAGHGRIVVGAPTADADGITDSGQVYIYDMQGTFINTISATDGQTVSDQFGDYEIAIGNGKIAVTAFIADGPSINSFSGSVYLYDLDGSNEIRLYDPAATSYDDGAFGTGLAIGHEKVVVGANRGEHFYIFDLDGSNMQKIASTGNTRISVANNRIVVGDYGKTVSESASGELRVYDMSGNLVNTIHQSNPTDHAFLGSSLAMYDTADARAHNFAPVVSNVDAAYTLTQGQDTVITAVGTDPEGDAITWSFEEIKSGASYVVVSAVRDDDNATDSGAVYVYDANDLSAQPTKLKAFDAAQSDLSGNNIAVTSDKIVVGTRLDDDNGSSSGSVYVYDASDLSAQPTKLTAFDGAEGDYFGISVAATSDKIVVGAPEDDDKGSTSGSVYVYDANDLSATPTKLTAFDGAMNDQFGYSVAATADKIVVSAHGDDSISGAVYVYDANDLSAQPTKLTAFDGAAGDFFGIPISVSDDKIVVGAISDDDRGSSSGSVYVFDANDLSAQPTKLTAFDGAANDTFGYSITVTADKIIVGAHQDDDNATNSGSVYVYDANDLSAQPTKLTAFDPIDYHMFGQSVAATDDKIFVGAGQDDDKGENAGAVYVFDANDLSSQPTKLTAYDGGQSDNFGFPVSTNSLPSALNDVTVSQSDNVFTITPGTTDSNFQLRITATDSEGNTTSVTPTFAYDYVNQAPAVSGIQSTYTLTQGQDTVITATGVDPEGDAITWSFEEVKSGSNYVVVGAQTENDNGTRSGAVYVYDASDLSSPATKLNLSSNAADDRLGFSVDVSDDKIVVGAPFDDDNGNDAGAVYVFDTNDLSATPIQLTANDSTPQDQWGDQFGRSVAVTSNKIVVGAMRNAENGYNAGAAYVFDISDLSAQPTKLTAYDGAASDQFGQFVAASDDKIVIGTPFDDDNADNSGSVYVYDANDLSAQPTKLTTFDGAVLDLFGYSVAVTDDKVIVGAAYDDENVSNSGSVYVYDANDLSAQPTKLTAFDNDTSAYFGWSVSANADKIVVGAPRDNDNGTSSGSVYVFDTNDLSAQPTKLTAFDGIAHDHFGSSVAISGDKIVVGSDQGQFNVYVYDLNDLSAQPEVLTQTDGFGNAVAAISAASALNGVTVAQSDNVFTVTPGTTDADFQLRITATDSEGNATSTTSDFDFTYVNQAPAVSGINAAYTLTQGQGTVITAAATDPEGDAITWSFEEVSSGSSYVVVGSKRDDNVGAAYIYEWDGSAVSNEVRVTVDSPNASDFTGSSVATNGSKVVIGSERNGTGALRAGALLITDMDGSNKILVTTSDAESNDYIGTTVAINSTKVAVGAHNDDDAGSRSGSVYLFDLDGTNEIKITASDAALSDFFGYSVALTETKVIVGAKGQDGSLGSVYVYDLDGSNEIQFSSSLTTGTPQVGQSLAASSSKIIAGTSENGAFIFDLDGSNEVHLTTSGSHNNYFGRRVAISGSKAVVTASHTGNSAAGEAYIFDLDGSNEIKITAPTPQLGDVFGASVEIVGDKILIGAYHTYQNHGGRVYIYELDGTYVSYFESDYVSSEVGDEYSFSIGSSTPSASLNGTTVTQSDNVFTVTPAQQDANFQLSFKATDTAGNATTVPSTFDFTYVNQAPSVAGIDAAYTLTQGQDTVITATGVDPEGDAITWSFEEVASGPSGDSKIVVGAQGDSNFAGAVYLYDLDGSNEIKIVPPNTIEQDRVGFDVAVANQKIYISAVLEDNESLNPEGQHGSVWIYDLDGSNGQILRADTDEHMLNFGRSVSAAGGKLAVYADGTDNSGKLFIYDADGSNEIQVTELQSGNGYAYDMIMDDSKIVVGNSNNLPVQVFNHDGTEAFKLTPSGSPNGYGSRVAMGSDKIAVAYENGAYVFNSDGTNEQIISGLSNLPELAIGSGKLVMVNTVVDTVYVYDIESLTLEASFSSSFTNYQFGFRVSVADNKIYVTNLNPTGVGTLEVYDLDGSNGYIINSNVSGDYYGYSVDVSDGAAQSALNGTTVTQSDNVFTVTPGTQDADFQLSFKATDTAGNATTVPSTFDFTYVNQAPSVTGIESSYLLSAGGSGTAITAAATDPEGDAITWSFEEVASGSSYVFVASPETTAGGEVKVYQESDLNTVVATLSPSDVAAGDTFGYGMTVAGDKVAISSRMDDNNGTRSGSVYVYDTNDFSAAPVHLVPSDGAAYDFLGGALISNSDKIVAMASNGSKVYVWDTNDLGGQPTVLAPADASNDLGWDLEIVGDNLLIGDPGKSWIYVYDLNDLSTSPSKITANDAMQGVGAGAIFPAYHGLASNDTYVAVGHERWSTGSGTQGAVYLFSVDDFSAPVHTIYAKDNNHIDSSVTTTGFGSGIGLSDDKLFVGNWNHTGGGAVYVYDLNDLTAQPSLLTPTNGDTTFGYRQSLNVSSTHLYVGAKNSSAMYAYELSDLSATPTRITGDAEFGHTIVSSAASSALNGTTVAQSDNVFTVTPGSEATSFSMRFTATDANGNATTTTSAFTVVDPLIPEMTDQSSFEQVFTSVYDAQAKWDTPNGPAITIRNQSATVSVGSVMAEGNIAVTQGQQYVFSADISDPNGDSSAKLFIQNGSTEIIIGGSSIPAGYAFHSDSVTFTAETDSVTIKIKRNAIVNTDYYKNLTLV